VMLAVLTWDFYKKSKASLGWGKAIILITLSFLFMEIAGLHPAILIIGLLLAAILKKDKVVEEGKETKREDAT
jgi:chromate transporter